MRRRKKKEEKKAKILWILSICSIRYSCVEHEEKEEESERKRRNKPVNHIYY